MVELNGFVERDQQPGKIRVLILCDASLERSGVRRHVNLRSPVRHCGIVRKGTSVFIYKVTAKVCGIRVTE